MPKIRSGVRLSSTERRSQVLMETEGERRRRRKERGNTKHIVDITGKAVYILLELE
jgi:hypothetical protein